MPYKNFVVILGHLGKDPQFYPTKKGGRIAKLTIATTEKLKNHDPITEWHKVTVFNENSVNYLEKYAKKGSLIEIWGGKITTNKWTDKDGTQQDSHHNYIKGIKDIVLPFDGRIEIFPSGDKSSGTYSDTSSILEQELDDDIPF